ncbi:DJ-1/PfpI family protein [Colletotrichum higginsianum IMI 349063]|uniref:DJ-1/PfpI family protein n=3 Tax=Colletotrichum higginsianum TaxID=80884 RepID=A0A1B7YJ11_COLHI|nr:DJ-1/PfpI family protein [Colletotrichum higginsianum IMI 349063]OBR11952.1 DJ-1/PfpI family protein [Colletotrichum higginsianum IMI 349063]TIC98892.1 Isonitrile hydratase [Colletotrichum higginsianum]
MHLDSRTPPRRYLALISVLLAFLSTMVAAQNGTETAPTVRQCIPRPTTTTGVPPPGPTPALPKNFGMVIHRAYEMLDVFGPLEALGVLARIHQLNLYLIAETMDPVTVEPGSAAMNSKNSSFFPVILPTHTYETAPEDIEVLIIPGGLWTRSPNIGPAISYIKTTYPRLRYLISVCTGASVVARAGVLDGRRATTNKASWASTIVHGPRTEWVAKARWVVDGNVWSSSGVSAGIDATLAFVEAVYGAENATYVADMMEYDWHRDSTWDPFAERFNVTDA